MKPYETLTFTDSFMFGKIMEDTNIGKAVLECFLQRKVGELKDVQVERGIQYTVDGKPIRLDVYTRDDAAVYDMEMQNLGHHPVEKLELPRRSRFYHSTIDSDLLGRGEPYRHLPENNVLFICTFDPFGAGLPIYTFKKRCMESDSLYLEDGVVTYFFNTMYNTGDGSWKISDNIRNMYAFIRTGQATDQLTDQLAAAVDRGRRNAIWRSDYMRELSLFMDLREEGREEGLTEGRNEGARMLAAVIEYLKDGKTDEELKDMGYTDNLISLAKTVM